MNLFWRSEEPAPTSRSVATTATEPAPVVATGDVKVEQVLAAYEAMQPAMAPAQLAIAIAATAKAIGGDPKQIATSLDKRLKNLDDAVRDEHKRSTERCVARTSELDGATAKIRAEIDTMKQRIFALERQLSGATSQVQQQNAEEQGRATAFEQRARAEASRLLALRDFLAKSL